MLIGGGIGLVYGICVIICILFLEYMCFMLQVIDEIFFNIGFIGKVYVFEVVFINSYRF